MTKKLPADSGWWIVAGFVMGLVFFVLILLLGGCEAKASKNKYLPKVVCTEFKVLGPKLDAYKCDFPTGQTCWVMTRHPWGEGIRSVAMDCRWGQERVLPEAEAF